MTITAKVCDTCHEEKPLADFRSAWNTSDGRRHICLACEERSKIRHLKRDLDYARNPERAVELRPAFPPLSRFTYTNSRIIDQGIVAPLVFLFDQKW